MSVFTASHIVTGLCVAVGPTACVLPPFVLLCGVAVLLCMCAASLILAFVLLPCVAAGVPPVRVPDSGAAD
jgi:hypothetical protein